MSTIEVLKKNSFLCIVDALITIGRIFENKTHRGSCNVSFETFDGNVKVLCEYGDLCTKSKCKYHHLHRDINKISENYVLCRNNLNCCDPNCKYRHTDSCRTLMEQINHSRMYNPDEYQKSVKKMISEIGAEELKYEEELFYNDTRYEFNKDIIDKALMDYMLED